MILSGAVGILQKFDTANRILTLNGRLGTQEYECAIAEPNLSTWAKLVGKTVDVQLCDFLVVDVSEGVDGTQQQLSGKERG